MERIPPLEKILYNYTTRENAENIKKSREIKPSPAGLYLSVNELGKFDYLYSGREKNKVWIDGRSDIPNIFLTDIPPEELTENCLGIGKKPECAFLITAKEIIEQGLNVYQNPGTQYSKFYNVPTTKGRPIKINPNNCIPVKPPLFVPKQGN
jgi:hypothetical protein